MSNGARIGRDWTGAPRWGTDRVGGGGVVHVGGVASATHSVTAAPRIRHQRTAIGLPTLRASSLGMHRI